MFFLIVFARIDIRLVLVEFYSDGCGLMKKKFLASMFAVVMILSLAACGGSGGAVNDMLVNTDKGMSSGDGFADAIEGNYDSGMSGDYEVSGSVDDGARESTDEYLANRKLVYTAYISAETKEYDKFVSWLGEQVDAMAGYVESMSEDQNQNRVSGYSMPYYDPDGYGYDRDYYMTRYACFTIRVPAKNLNAFLELVGGNCNITSRSTDSDDVTLTYVDIEGRIAALEMEIQRLEELLTQAGDLSDLITLESRLSEVRGELEGKKSQLRTFDNQVDFATVNLDISEVIEFTENQGLPEGYFGQLWAAFCHGLQEFRYGFVLFTFWLAENLLTLAFWIAVVIILVRVLCKRKSGSRKAGRGFGRRFLNKKPAGTEPAQSGDDKRDEHET